MSGSDAAQSLAVVPVISDQLIVIFIHGFKGTDETFASFPERLQHILAESIPNASVECIVFPAYETKGDLVEAVVKFADWLTTLTVEKEVASGGGSGTAKIVLCGHSMGGLLAADTLKEFVKGRPDAQAPLWPKIIGCIAFDTPYLGLHPGVFKNSATKAVEYAQTARAVGGSLFGAFAGLSASKAAGPAAPARPATPPAAAASGWGKWAGTATYAVGGALLAGAAAGATYYKRDDLNLTFTWATDHMKYVGHLWDADALNRRVDFLVNAEAQEGVVFRNFYTYLPPTPLLHDSVRTFIVLPKKNSPAEPFFVLARNGLAPDELEAHTGMFSGKTNDGYYDLGLQTAQLIERAVMNSRGVLPTTQAPAGPTPSKESTSNGESTPSWEPISSKGPAPSKESTPSWDSTPNEWASPAKATPAANEASEWGSEWR
ncbi:hypothetical protein B0H17DRAFT_1073235 [Mycena rosella]|uniref:DUF676 domain-containing protein n=1 Tax=Mycena rosella TaxID=1033263 RepID=A0AAD7GAW5_MYCRO|nr:hypothetical protein B0H17DRAFT_1073235 [Mycena rosella]